MSIRPEATSPCSLVVLTAPQVALMLQVSLRTVQRLTASGSLPHRIIGNRTVRYTIADIEDFLADSRRIRRDAQVVVVPPARRGGRGKAKLVS